MLPCSSIGVNGRHHYSRPEWANFYAYNAVRADFTDYNRYDYSPAKGHGYREAGWDKIDVDMLHNWFFADRDRYSLAKMQQVAAAAPRRVPPSFRETALNVLSNLPRFPPLIGLMLASVCGAFLPGSGWRADLLPGRLSCLASLPC